MQEKKYNVIYADPPWQYRNKTTGRNHVSGAKSKYNTMSLEEICAMIDGDLKGIIDNNSVLFLWATVPLMPEAMQVLKSWGFTYKTMITWRKIMSQGMGNWFRGQCEHLLLGVKGTVKPFRQQVANFYESEEFELDECYQHKVGKHSQKPHYFREMISKATLVSFPNPQKLELFGRSREGLFPDYEYQGWDVHGNQINGSILSPSTSFQSPTPAISEI